MWNFADYCSARLAAAASGDVGVILNRKVMSSNSKEIFLASFWCVSNEKRSGKSIFEETGLFSLSMMNFIRFV